MEQKDLVNEDKKSLTNNKVVKLFKSDGAKNIYSKISMIYSFVSCAVKIILGIMISSYFFASATYSFCFGLAKINYRQGVKKSASDAENQRKYYVKVAVLILLGSLVYSIYMARLFFVSAEFNYGKILGITIAFLSFSELTFAIINLSKTKSLIHGAVRNMSLASAFLSLSFTQVAVTSFASEADISKFNGLGGVIFGCLAMGVAIVMLIKVFRLKRA